MLAIICVCCLLNCSHLYRDERKSQNSFICSSLIVKDVEYFLRYFLAILIFLLLHCSDLQVQVIKIIWTVFVSFTWTFWIISKNWKKIYIFQHWTFPNMNEYQVSSTTLRTSFVSKHLLNQMPMFQYSKCHLGPLPIGVVC